MKLRHFSISQIGDSHITGIKKCQDYSETKSVINENLGIEMALAAIADGVGSCDYSDDGSRIAVTSAMTFLHQELTSLNEISEKTVLPALKKAFQFANDNIEKESEERELPFLLFDTTLTVTVLTETGVCYFGHIGDDGVVALFIDGTYRMITNRIEGEEANSVIPLSSIKNWTFGTTEKPVAALALMTDGLLDKSVGSELMNNRVFYPFFKPMFENIMENEQDEVDLKKIWNENLHDERFRKDYGVTDDITLAIVQVPEILKHVQPYPFDEEKWKEMTNKTREEIEKKLVDSAAVRKKGVSVSQDQIQQEDASETVHNDEIIVQSKPQTSQSTQNAEHQQRKQICHDKNAKNNEPCGSNEYKTAFSLFTCVICALALALISGFIGFHNGEIKGQEQEQASTQRIISRLQQEHEAELAKEYNRGFTEGKKSVTTATPRTILAPMQFPSITERTLVSRGKAGKSVTAIQEMLIKKGWDLISNGFFDNNTESAVREFQANNSLPITGEVDFFTYWMLKSDQSVGYKTLEGLNDNSSSVNVTNEDNLTSENITQ